MEQLIAKEQMENNDVVIRGEKGQEVAHYEFPTVEVKREDVLKVAALRALDKNIPERERLEWAKLYLTEQYKYGNDTVEALNDHTIRIVPKKGQSQNH